MPEDQPAHEVFGSEAEITALELRFAVQTERIVNLEQTWVELTERVERQSQRREELERELERLRETTAHARAERRAASTELSRAERRTSTADERLSNFERESAQRLEELDQRLAEQIAETARLQETIEAQENELLGAREEAETEKRLAFELEAAHRERLLAAAGEADRLRSEAADTTTFARRLEQELEAAEARASRAEAQASRAEESAARSGRQLERQAGEERALVADLVRTQGTLQARSEQLGNILRSRWHRVARSAWQARRRRPPVVAIAILAVAVGGAVATVAFAADLGALIAGLLAAAILAAAGAVYSVVVPALRDKRVPRMAGDGSFVQSLEDAEVEPEAGDPPQASAPRPDSVQRRPEVRLVPAPVDGAVIDLERRRWLGGALGPELGQLRVAAILDEMSKACFGPECHLDTDFGAEDWRQRLEAHPPHLLLVESAWSGNSGSWQYGVASYPHPRYRGLPRLRELVEWCREKQIPTAFWNKEDPVHFDRFKEAAALFDHVFTTDADRIDAYSTLDELRAKTVEPLQFAAQPRLHNPIAAAVERRDEPVFAGTYYRDRHAGRRDSLDAILDAARPHGLIIYDRMLGADEDAYGFPERFQPHIRGRLPYRDTVAAYKRHKVFLNVNSVVDSPTMFSRRVFELLACGTAVLSTESNGMTELFGDLVPVARTESEAREALASLLGDDAYRSELTSRAKHLVLGRHTYRERLLQVARAAGFEFAESSGEETAALVVADEQAELRAASASLLSQSKTPDEILFGLGNGVVADLERLSERFEDARIRTVKQELGASDSDRMRELASLSAARWVAPLKPDVDYGPDHLKDLLACTRFADAEVIGFSDADPGGGGGNRYEASVSPETAIAQRGVVAARGWPDDGREMRSWFAQGVRIYAGDPPGA